MSGDHSTPIKGHPVVSREQWLSAREAFLAKEKEFTRLRDDLSRQRRELPWVRVDKQYVFDGPAGKVTLAELFEDRSQLIVYHFMFSPDDDEGCLHCSFWADNFNGNDVHLKHRDITFVAISRAPLAKIAAFKKRMGWDFKWLSSFHNDFNFDFRASFKPDQVDKPVFNFGTQAPGMQDREGASVFYKDEDGAVFHTYSTFSRGIDMLNGAYHFIDLSPRGRDEEGLEGTQDWVRHHDRYQD